jgi:hypothetical protein
VTYGLAAHEPSREGRHLFPATVTHAFPDHRMHLSVAFGRHATEERWNVPHQADAHPAEAYWVEGS